MRDNLKGRKSRRLSQGQNEAQGDTRLLNTTPGVSTGYLHISNQEESKPKSQSVREEVSRKLTRRSKNRANHQVSEKTSGQQISIETVEKSPTRKRKSMDDRRDLDMEETDDPDTTMRSILRHLGSGFEVFAPQFSEGTSRISSLLNMMQSEDMGDQMTGVSELCEYLSISTEDSMIMFPVDQVVPVLVKLLNSSPDLMLLSCRAITLLVDVRPSSAKQISEQGGIEALCNKLVCIEYIDVAEQSIQAMGKISGSYPEILFERGALNAILSFVDFFQIGIQRIAVSTAAKICSVLGAFTDDEVSVCVGSIVPTLEQLMFSADNKISLSACEALTSISLNCKHRGKSVESVMGLDFLKQAIQKVGQSNMTMKPCVFYAMLGLLSECASSSQQACMLLLESNVIQVISNIVASVSNNFGESINNSLKPRDPEDTHTLLSLINSMLPAVVTHDLKVFKSRSKQCLKVLSSLETHSTIFQAPSEEKEEVREFLIENPPKVDFLCSELACPILNMEFVSLPPKSRSCYLSIMDKLLFYSSVEYLSEMFSQSPIAAFMIRLLQSSDCLWIFCCLKFASSLLQKDKKFKVILLREGVLNEMETLSDRKELFATDALKEACTWFTGRIRVCYLPDGGVCEDDMEGLVFLRKIKEKFPKSEAFKDFLDLIMDHSVSAFEVYRSGIMEEIYSFLSDSTNECEFLEAWMKQNKKPDECLERLIDIVQDLLMTCEHFPVYSTTTQSAQRSPYMYMRTQNTRNRNRLSARELTDPFDSGLKALASPLRIRLCCLDKDIYTNATTIMIEPLATVSQIQAYLKPRIKQMLDAQSRETEKTDNVRITRSRARTLGFRDGMGKSRPDSTSKGTQVDHKSRKGRMENNDQAECRDDNDLNASLSFEGEECQELASLGKVNRNEEGQGNECSDFSISFSVNGVVLDSSTTLLKAFLDGQPRVMENGLLDLKHIWTESHQLDFRVIFDAKSLMESRNEISASIALGEDYSVKVDRESDKILSQEDVQVRFALGVLQALEKIWVLSKPDKLLDRPEFFSNPSIKNHLVNNKVCSKLIRQLKDPLLVCSRALPTWCSILPYKNKFLFSYESRSMYFRYHAFGLGRTVLAILEDAPWLSYGNAESQDSLPFAAPRISRQKVRISRSHILESARKVFGRYANADSRLEVEFYGEVGSGLGPTLEFYTLLSREFQRKSMNMWRSDINSRFDQNEEVDEDYIASPQGLFPQPLDPKLSDSDATCIINNFSLLGHMVAKDIQDGRLLDIHFSRAFYKLAIHGKSLDAQDLLEIDPELFKSLIEIKNSTLQSDGSHAVVNGAHIDDLCLTFVLPGHEMIELCPGGGEISVTSENACEYVDRVFEYILSTGVEKQIKAFREGFNKVFPIHHLEIFYENEIDLMVCGDVNSDQWTFETISSAMRCDHGYSSDSGPVVNLIKVLLELDNQDKRRFLKFVTGSPRLPAGGFLALNPRLTIVRKGPDLSGPISPKSGEDARKLSDNDLPSVMTCANYFKLPPYSSKDILKNRLLFAIREGQGSFDLS